MKDLLFVYNPNSGQRAINDKLSWIIEYLSSKGILANVYATQKSGDCREIIEEIGGNYEHILVSGGDGTLDEAISGALKADIDPIFSYLPTGSTNDFSKSINIAEDIEKATKTALRGREKKIDIGRIEDKYFVYVAAFGALSDISFSTDQDMKNFLGRSAYIIEGIKKALPIQNIASYHAKILCDGELVSGDFIHFMVTNSISVGGFTGLVGDNVSLEDGIFEVTMIRKPKNLTDINKIIQALTNNEENEMLIQKQARKIEIETDQPVAWSLDGEFGGESTTCVIDVVKQRIRIKTGLKD